MLTPYHNHRGDELAREQFKRDALRLISWAAFAVGVFGLAAWLAIKMNF